MPRYGSRILLAALLAGCTRAAPVTRAYPSGPGLLEGRPPQPPGSYRVVGWVLEDQTAQPVANATVQVPGTRVIAHTDQWGRYFLENVPRGNGTVSVRALGHTTEIRRYSQKEPQGLWMGPLPSFTDTLSFWLHREPLRIGKLDP